MGKVDHEWHPMIVAWSVHVVTCIGLDHPQLLNREPWCVHSTPESHRRNFSGCTQKFLLGRGMESRAVGQRTEVDGFTEEMVTICSTPVSAHTQLYLPS